MRCRDFDFGRLHIAPTCDILFSSPRTQSPMARLQNDSYRRHAPTVRPLCGDLAALLRALPDEDWDRPTLAGAWRVRDVVAHLLDTALRRLSLDRDGRVPPPAARAIENDRDLVAFITELNAIWIRASQPLSARVLTDLYALAGEQLSDFMETVNLDHPARFPVSWAGPAGPARGSISDANSRRSGITAHKFETRSAPVPLPKRTGCGPCSPSRCMRFPMPTETCAGSLVNRSRSRLRGGASGSWTLTARESGWEMDEGGRVDADAKVAMSDDVGLAVAFFQRSAAIFSIVHDSH